MHRHFDDVFQQRSMGPKVERLKDHCKACANALDLTAIGRGAIGTCLNLFAINYDLAGCRGFQKVDAPQHRRFARSTAANDCHNVPLTRRERDALEHLQRTKGFVQVIDANGILCGRCCLGCLLGECDVLSVRGSGRHGWTSLGFGVVRLKRGNYSSV